MRDGRVRLKLTLADGSEKQLYGRNREEVVAKADTLRLAEQQGELVTSGRFPYGKWLSQWLEDFVKVRNALTTYEKYRGLVVHHVVGALNPAWVGGDQVRQMRFDGERLVLQADVPKNGARIRHVLTWERVTA